LLILALALLALGGGGYLAGRQLWALGHWRQARQALDDGDAQLALAGLGKCLQVWPNDAEARLLLARAHALAGDREEAFRHLHAWKDATGDAAGAAFEALLLDATLGRLEQAEEALRRQAEAGHPETRRIREALVRGCLARQRDEEAERLATEWIDAAPEDWRPWFLRAVARSQASRQLLSTAFDRAKRDFERALELKPDHAPARFLLGNAHVMTGQFREALPHLETFCRQKPEEWPGVVALARCRRGLGQVEEARQALDAWLAGHEGTAEVFLLRGEVATDLNRPEEALDYCRRAEALAPAHEKTLYHLALALRALGRTEEANAYEQKWRSRQELTKRLQELEQVAAREPRNVSVRHEAGAAALRLGQEESGLRWLAGALQIDPGHRPTHEALADHFHHKGNHQAAAFHRRLAEQGPRGNEGK
jgi:tetratricopeptide (TPR) repeat protein